MAMLATNTSKQPIKSVNNTNVVDPLKEMWNHKDTAVVVQAFKRQHFVDDIVATTPPRPLGLVVRYIDDVLPDDTIALELAYPYPIFFAHITNRRTPDELKPSIHPIVATALLLPLQILV